MKEKVLFLPHMGFGDQLLSYGIVIGLLKRYAEVTLVIKDHYRQDIETLYNTEPRVKFCIESPERKISPLVGVPVQTTQLAFPDHDICFVGSHIGRRVHLNIFPLSFYDDANVPRINLWSECNFIRSIESLELYNKIKDIPYIFLHNYCSQGVVFDEERCIERLHINPDETLVINTHNNRYSEDHPFYHLANLFLQKRNMLDYCYILENAQKIIVSDSAMFSFCHILNIKSSENYVIPRRGMIYDHLYIPSTYRESDESFIRVKFRKLNK